MSNEEKAARVEQQLGLIKAHMPEVYGAIKAKAEQIGKTAYGLVRRGVAGEPNCFYAFERGRVVGTPFAQEVTDDVAGLMVRFGATFVCIIALPEQEATSAPH